MAETEPQHYAIVRVPDGWGVRHGDELTSGYLTKEAAFEAAAAAASNAIKVGLEVTVTVEGRARGEAAIG